MERLGMEEEELERLLDNSGMTIRGTKEIDGFVRAGFLQSRIIHRIFKVNSSSFQYVFLKITTNSFIFYS